jgi:ABC-type nitrate/sulfonate/bicarbonate transport system substrate-binding protein
MIGVYAERRSTIASTICLVLFLSWGGAMTYAAEPKLIPLRLAYSAITVNQAIPWIAYEAGHFRKHGLDMELIHASSITALQALLAGEVAIAQSVTDACVSSNLQGADTLFMGAILDKPLYSFIVNSKIKTPQDLKGKRIGVTRFGSTPDALARAMLKMWNLDPVSDVTLVQLNEMGLLVQGLVNGVIDAAPISIPGNIRAKNLGFVELFDMTKIGKAYITGTVVTRKRFIEGQPDIAKRFMRGFLEGMKTYLEDEEFSVKVIQKWTRAKNRDEVKEAYRLQARNMLRNPRTPLDGVRTILDGLDKIPAAKTADPRRFIDFTILDELEKEGFLKNLYRS